MSIQFYYGSGSPFSWNVWLVLEHKRLPYQFKLLSLQNGELKQAGYLAINPHGKVPALVDDDFAIWEALAIVEYLEERYPEYPVFPSTPKDRAIARRLSAEAYSYLYPALRKLMELTLLRQDGDGEPAAITAALTGLGRELDYFEEALHGDYFVGNISVADFTIYPLLALVKRLHERWPQRVAGALLGHKLSGFIERMERLPYFPNTTPPHWQG
ncbi:MAG: glutathione S-transferase family protein [Methylobacter sp.]|nr:MAG: glutathione S-transferase family protein [Methylobacter sp.]